MKDPAGDPSNGDRPESVEESIPQVEALSTLRRAARGLEANLREAARLLRRRSGPPDDVAA